MKRILFLCCLFFALSGCGAHENAPQVCVKNSCYNVEIADEPDEREKGLMFREELGEGSGMLFVFLRDGEHPFWMKHTFISLDMLWLNSDREIVYIEQAVPVCEIEDCPVYGSDIDSRYVLELNAGEVLKNEIVIGDVVQFKSIDL